MVEHAVLMKGREMHLGFWLGNVRETKNKGEPVVDARTVLK
jgi:hypothetical protein